MASSPQPTAAERLAVAVHYAAAEQQLERADYLANADGWTDRDGPPLRALLAAQVHATLHLADAVLEAASMTAKATYDGRI